MCMRRLVNVIIFVVVVRAAIRAYDKYLEREESRDFDGLYGESLRALHRDDLVRLDPESFGPDDEYVSAAPGPDFGPED